MAMGSQGDAVTHRLKLNLSWNRLAALVALGTFLSASAVRAQSSRSSTQKSLPKRVAIVPDTSGSLSVVMVNALRSRFIAEGKHTGIAVVPNSTITNTYVNEDAGRTDGASLSGLSAKVGGAIVLLAADSAHGMLRVRARVYSMRDTIGLALVPVTVRTRTQAAAAMVAQIAAPNVAPWLREYRLTLKAAAP